MAAFPGGAAMPGFENQTQAPTRFQPLLGNGVAVAADQDAIEKVFLPKASEPQERTDGLARPWPGMHKHILIQGRPLTQPAAQQLDQVALPQTWFDGRGGRDRFPQGVGARTQAKIKGGWGHDRILAPHRHGSPCRCLSP